MDNTRADDKLLGFVYQFYYFLLELLKMQKNDIVGFEVKDDVHIDGNTFLSLIQLKHTRRTKANGKPINLTSSDIDLWKTLSNWTDLINKQSDKDDFINHTQFVFITNKSASKSHVFLVELMNLKTKDDFTEFRNKIIKYKDSLGIKNKNKIYISKLLSLDDEVLQKFALKIEFIFDLNNIVSDIKYQIKYGKLIRDNRVDKVFQELNGELWSDFFDVVKNRGDFQFTQEEFYLKTHPIFNNAQSNRLPFNRNIKQEKCDSIFEKTFAKQLTNIGFDKDKIFEADYHRLAMETNLNEFIQNGEISSDDKDLFDANTVTSWKEEFDEKYLDSSQKTQLGAQQLYLAITKKDLDLAGQKIEWKEAIKGQFIRMSNIPKIGWLYNWKEVYKSE